MFVHLNCHSFYSFLKGASRVDELVFSAAEAGMSALALTDTNGLYGAVSFYKSAQQAGIRAIFGAEIQSLNGKRAVILARNTKGFGEVCRIITDRHLREDFSLEMALKQSSHDVIILCPDPNLLEHIVRERGTNSIAVEVVPRRDNMMAELIAFSRRSRIPLVATNRVFFVHKKDWEIHRLISAIKASSTIDALPKETVISPESWLKPPEEMQKLFSDYPQAAINTLRVAEQCEVELPIGRIRLPPFETPPGETTFSFLKKLAREGIAKLYHPIPSAARERLHHELKVIQELSLSSYFLIVWDIVQEAHRRGIVTVGRGSAANSLVCRTLGITEVDPIQHNLYFERFLNLERVDCPDIDIDFPWNRRDEILDYVFQKYGHENVALISAHVHLRGRSALRETGKALGIPIQEIDAFTSKIPHSTDLLKLGEIRECVPECKDLPLEDEPYRSMIYWGKKIEGFPRHLSIHCGGIVISPVPITDSIPLQKTPKGFVVTQYDMYPVEDTGLIKIDLLSQKGLAVEIDTIQAVWENHHVHLDFSRIDAADDERTKKLIRTGNTTGCFYIESPGMKNLLKKLDVTNFDTLTAASSIIRPGVSDSGMIEAFIDRHNGKKVVCYLHPKLEPLLRQTYGIMIYQEDVIKVANVIAGMNLGEAEGLRKCMSKKRDWEKIENYKNRFISGARKNGVTKTIAEKIWRQIESFAGYAFCKAHSASFAMVSYRAAYLKARFPAEFMAAVLSNQGGFYGTDEYIEEARRMGLKVLLPHINYSHHKFSVEYTRKKMGKPGAVRVGLQQIKNLSASSINSILAEKTRKPFASLCDFLSRVNTDEQEVDKLIRCGAFDGLGETRPEMLWKHELFRRKKQTHIRNQNGQVALFDITDSLNLAPRLPEYGSKEKIFQELECLGVAVSHHPLALYGIRYEDPSSGISLAENIPEYSGKLATLAGWLVTYKRTRTSNGDLMKFLTLEDPTGLFEVTLFPKVYCRFGHLLHDHGPYIVRGRIERDGRCFTVTASWLERWTPSLTYSANTGTAILKKPF